MFLRMRFTVLASGITFNKLRPRTPTPADLVKPDISQDCEQPNFHVTVWMKTPDGADGANICFLNQVFGLSAAARERQRIAI